MIPPGGAATRRVVNETVSLRDLAATVVDVIGQEAGSPFPGNSLARFWDGTSAAGTTARGSRFRAGRAGLAQHSAQPRYLSLPQDVVAAGRPQGREWSYIRHEGDVREELFHLGEDAREQHNLASDPATLPMLERMRATLGRITGGPLVPTRFSP